MRWGYEPLFAKDGNEALRILEGPDPPMIAILDWMMPGEDGIEVARRIRLNRPSPYIYMMMATSKARRQNVLTCLEAGADDYLSKPIDPDELRARLYVAGRILALQQNLMSACVQAQYEATHDSVTGLWNRTAILKFLDHYLDRCASGEASLALVLLEVLGLKEVNVVHGRAVGDYALREVGSRWRGVANAYDCIGHYVGAQFLLVMPDCPISRATALVDQMQIKVNSPGISLGSDFYIPFSLRASVLTVDRGLRQNAHDVLHRLDRNLVANPYHPGAGSSQINAIVADLQTAGPTQPVLILSSDPMQRRLVAQKVRDRGYLAQEAADPGEAARALHGEKPIGLLIFDMRGSDAAELDSIEFLRKDKSVADLEIVLLAAWPTQATVNRALSLNVSNFLTKPVDGDKLGQIITRVLGAPPAPLDRSASAG